jgi:hypothetical protein
MNISKTLDYLRRQDALFKKRPELKKINEYGYQCLQELSALISIYRFGDIGFFEKHFGKLSRKTKKEIETFHASERQEYKQADLFT